MAFDKLILWEKELTDFERLLIRDKIITNMNPDYSPVGTKPIISKGTKNSNRTRLLKAIMIFEKIDAVNLSHYDLSPLVDCGLVDERACLLDGSESASSSKVVDSAWKYKNKLIDAIISITNSVLKSTRIEMYPTSLITREDLLDLCDAYMFGSQEDFLLAYEEAAIIMLQHYYRFDVDINMALERVMYTVSKNVDMIYSVLDSVPYDKDQIPIYLDLFEELQSKIQKYYVPYACLSCERSWKRCCENSEFMYTHNFSCSFREELGEQRFAKFNGLSLSSDNNAVLFDNSICFQGKDRKTNNRIELIEEVYHIVNVDLSEMLESLPTPLNAREAIRTRNRPEIVSFRNILYHWGECLSSGDLNTAEYIKKDFDTARRFFEKKETNDVKRRSLFHCFFEALGNQIPYLSNIVGIITPFSTRKRLLEEEKHRWFLLTR